LELEGFLFSGSGKKLRRGGRSKGTDMIEISETTERKSRGATGRLASTEAKELHEKTSPACVSPDCLGREERCPLCGGDNRCRVAEWRLYKGACWCHEIIVPDHVLKRLSADSDEPACLCRSCLETVAGIAREIEGTSEILAETQRVIGDRATDFYEDAGGNTVFTAAYHLKRGNCCDNGCRHCPY
jgi:hypothetical protein